MIDLKYVFDHYPGFARAKTELEIDMQLSEAMLALRKCGASWQTIAEKFRVAPSVGRATVLRMLADEQRSSRESQSGQHDGA